jgi:hypothetical protein
MFANHTLRGLAVAIGSFAFASMGQATVINIPTSAGSGADAMIDGNGSHATTNYGSLATSGYRFLDSGGTNRNERTYLRFQLPNDIDTVNSATITLYKVDTNTIKTVELHGLTNESLDNWVETSITFNAAPAGTAFTTRQPDGADSDLLSNQGISSGANATVVLNNSANMVNFLNGDTNGLVTFILSDADNSFAYSEFATKENVSVGAFAPTLNLDYNPIPEPASFATIGLGIAAFAVRRVRHGARG